MDIPSILHVQVTERCNLACPGCYLPDRSGPLVSAERLMSRVFTPLAAAGVRFTTITGGEPLLHPDIVAICAAARRVFDEVQIVTNGMRLVPDTFERLRQAGVTSIKFSLDGATAAVHDALRGRVGAFDRLSANIRAIAALPPDRRHGVEMGAITTVQPANIGQLREIAALARDFGLSHLLLQPLHPFDPVYPPHGRPVKRPPHDPAYLSALDEALAQVRRDLAERPGFLDNSDEMLDLMHDFHARQTGPAQRCGAGRFLFVNSRLEVRGCLYSQPFDSLAEATPEQVFAGPGWNAFQRFRRRCTLCLMGCQFYGPAQRLAERGFVLLDTKRPGPAKRLFQASLARCFTLEAAHGLARCDLLDGQAGRAARELGRLVGMAPERLVLRADLAEALAAAGRSDAALALLDAACAESPASAVLAHKRGFVLRDLGRFAEAAEAFARVVAMQPGHAFAGGDLCGSLLAAGRPAEALAAGERAVTLTPDAAHAWHQHGLALAAADRLEEGATALARALSLEPDHDFAGSDLCGDLRRLGRLDEALDTGGRAVQSHPESAHAWHQYALALCESGRRGEADRAFGKTLELDPDHPFVGGDLCDVLRRLGRLDEALDMGRRAVALTPDSAHAWHQYALAVCESGGREEAERAFGKTLELDPDHPFVGGDLCDVLRRLGRLDEALDMGGRAVALTPDSAHAWHQYGLALAAAGRLDEAAGAFARSMEISPEHLYAGGDRCDVLRRLGRLDEALQAGERAVRLSPASAHAAHQHGLALAAVKNDREAVTRFLQAAKLHPDGPWVRFDLGMCCQRLGDLRTAREHLAAAAELDPGMPWFQYRLGLLVEELGDPAQALRHMRRAMELGPGEQRIVTEHERMLRHHGEMQS